jgi:hypothetical protein
MKQSDQFFYYLALTKTGLICSSKNNQQRYYEQKDKRIFH